MRTEIYCPKCEGTDIKTERLTPERVDRVSMDRMGSPRTTSLVYSTAKFKATCQGCGYAVEYSVMYGD